MCGSTHDDEKATVRHYSGDCAPALYSNHDNRRLKTIKGAWRKPEREKRANAASKFAQKSADAQIVGGFYGLFNLVVSQSVHHVVEVW